MPGARVTGCATVPEPECPRRRRSNRNHPSGQSPALRAGRGQLDRVAQAPRSAAGRDLSCSTPGDFDDLRPARSLPPSTSVAEERLACAALGDGVSGPFRAASKTYRKLEQQCRPDNSGGRSCRTTGSAACDQSTDVQRTSARSRATGVRGSGRAGRSSIRRPRSAVVARSREGPETDLVRDPGRAFTS